MATSTIAAVTRAAGGLLLTGDLDGNLFALDASNGKTLYAYDTNAIAGGVITYRANGKQYVAVAAGSVVRGLGRYRKADAVCVRFVSGSPRFEKN